MQFPSGYDSPALVCGYHQSLCCPMTTQIKNYPFEVVISSENPSAVLADQVKSLDWRKRRARRKGAISAAELAEVRAKIRALIG